MLRRDFLGLSALPLLSGVGLAGTAPANSCILLTLVGGPSHLDTWDMKPDAPSEFRGPFRPINTNVPGIEISEIFPRMARHADKYALIRSVYHDAPAVHAAGLQLMQTGYLSDAETEYPHIGCVVSKVTGSPHYLLPGPVVSTGGTMPHGQTAGFLGAAYEPVHYGGSNFGRNCLRARQLIEAGARFVTVNMFETIFDRPTWDSHGSKPFSSIRDYQDSVGPMFDLAYTSLLEDLHQRGLLETTLVVAMGEFGRSPRINPAGGRDHWPQCWTILMAGGGIRGGQIFGSSDSCGEEPRDNPVTPGMVQATIYQALGLRPEDLFPHPLEARPEHPDWPRGVSMRPALPLS